MDFALVAELVDAADLKSVGIYPVPVRFRPSAPFYKKHLSRCFFAFAGLKYMKSDCSISKNSNFLNIIGFSYYIRTRFLMA